MNRFEVEFKLNKIEFSEENNECAKYIIYQYLEKKYHIKEPSSNFIFDYCYYNEVDSDIPNYTKIFYECIRMLDFINEFKEHEEKGY